MGHLGQDVLARTLCPVSDTLPKTSWSRLLCPIVILPLHTIFVCSLELLVLSMIWRALYYVKKITLFIKIYSECFPESLQMEWNVINIYNILCKDIDRPKLTEVQYCHHFVQCPKQMSVSSQCSPQCSYLFTFS